MMGSLHLYPRTNEVTRVIQRKHHKNKDTQSGTILGIKLHTWNQKDHEKKKNK
jgi:hypothetical protein